MTLTLIEQPALQCPVSYSFSKSSKGNFSIRSSSFVCQWAEQYSLWAVRLSICCMRGECAVFLLKSGQARESQAGGSWGDSFCSVWEGVFSSSNYFCAAGTVPLLPSFIIWEVAPHTVIEQFVLNVFHFYSSSPPVLQLKDCKNIFLRDIFIFCLYCVGSTPPLYFSSSSATCCSTENESDQRFLFNFYRVRWAISFSPSINVPGSPCSLLESRPTFRSLLSFLVIGNNITSNSCSGLVTQLRSFILLYILLVSPLALPFHSSIKSSKAKRKTGREIDKSKMWASRLPRRWCLLYSADRWFSQWVSSGFFYSSSRGPWCIWNSSPCHWSRGFFPYDSHKPAGRKCKGFLVEKAGVWPLWRHFGFEHTTRWWCWEENDLLRMWWRSNCVLGVIFGTRSAAFEIL